MQDLEQLRHSEAGGAASNQTASDSAQSKTMSNFTILYSLVQFSVIKFCLSTISFQIELNS